jgi:hypothetical protein
VLCLMDRTREQGSEARRMDLRAATWLAWPLWTLIVATIGFGFLLWPVSEGALIPLVLSTAVPFAIVASRIPYNPVGWLFIAFGAAAAIRFTGSQYATYALLNHPGSLPVGVVRETMQPAHVSLWLRSDDASEMVKRS